MTDGMYYNESAVINSAFKIIKSSVINNGFNFLSFTSIFCVGPGKVGERLIGVIACISLQMHPINKPSKKKKKKSNESVVTKNS